MGNCGEYLLAVFAAAKLGAIAVMLNPAYTISEVETALRTPGCCMFLTSLNYSHRTNIAMIRHLAPKPDNCSTVVPTLKNIVICSLLGTPVPTELSALPNFHTLIHGASARQFALDSTLSEYDIVNLQFTSGTTGLPKAASLTHHNILNNARFVGQRMQLTSSDRICVPPPLFHCFGFVLGCLATFTHGAVAVFASEVFDEVSVLETVHSERCTGLHGVPTMFIALMKQPTFDKFDLTSLRTGIAAGSSMPPEIMNRIHRKMHLTDLTICYGMTETSPVSTQTTRHDAISKRITTVGRLLPHTTAKIVDPVSGNTIPIGQRGELCVAGYLLMKGYWLDAKRTADVIKMDEQGVRWMHTGDEAVIDADGYISITGRIKDLIIRGGENIAPLEIEDRLMAMPGLSQASVVGVKDKQYGEVVGAFVATVGVRYSKMTEDEIRAWVGAKLARFKVPKYIFWMGKNGVPDHFPCTASGKIRKVELQKVANRLISQEAPIAGNYPT